MWPPPQWKDCLTTKRGHNLQIENPCFRHLNLVVSPTVMLLFKSQLACLALSSKHAQKTLLINQSLHPKIPFVLMLPSIIATCMFSLYFLTSLRDRPLISPPWVRDGRVLVLSTALPRKHLACCRSSLISSEALIGSRSPLYVVPCALWCRLLVVWSADVAF